MVDMSAQQPWDGPAPEQNSKAQSKHLTWGKGTNGKNGPPDSPPSVHFQYGDKTQGLFTDGQILHQINDGNQQAMSSEAGGMTNLAGVLAGVTNMTSSILITAKQIVHKLGNSALVVSHNNVSLMVGGNGGSIFPEMLAGLPGIIANAVGQILIPLNVPQSTVQAMASAAMGTVAGLVTKGSPVSSSAMNVLALVTSVISSLFGDLLTALQQSTLATALAAEIETELGGTVVTITDAVWALTSGGQTIFSTNLDLTSVLSPGVTVVIANVLSSPTVVFNGTFTVVSVTPEAVVVTQAASVLPGLYISGGQMTTSGSQQDQAKVNAATVPTLVAALMDLIVVTLPQDPAPLDAEQVLSLANTIVSDVISQSAIMAQPSDMSIGFEMSDSNMASMQTQISSAMSNTGSNAGIPSSVMSIISSSVSSQVKAVSGGSVVSLLPQLLSYRGVNLLTGKSQQITKTAQTNFKINGVPVDVNG
jgi:hypothetical protein